jgi:hypothetical protein
MEKLTEGNEEKEEQLYEFRLRLPLPVPLFFRNVSVFRISLRKLRLT